MNQRERVLAVLNGQKADRVPWFGDLDYWATALIGRGQKPQDFKRSDAYLDWHRDLGVGFYLQGIFPFLRSMRVARSWSFDTAKSGTVKSRRRAEL